MTSGPIVFTTHTISSSFLINVWDTGHSSEGQGVMPSGDYTPFTVTSFHEIASVIESALEDGYDERYVSGGAFSVSVGDDGRIYVNNSSPNTVDMSLTDSDGAEMLGVEVGEYYRLYTGETCVLPLPMPMLWSSNQIYEFWAPLQKNRNITEIEMSSGKIVQLIKGNRLRKTEIHWSDVEGWTLFNSRADDSRYSRFEGHRATLEELEGRVADGDVVYLHDLETDETTGPYYMRLRESEDKPLVPMSNLSKNSSLERYTVVLKFVEI